MGKSKISENGLSGMVNKLFPERQIYFRSDGVVKFLSLSTGVQLFLATLTLILSSWIGVTSYKFVTRDALLEARENSIQELATANAQINTEMETLQTEVIKRTEKLEERQRYLQGLMALDPESAFDLNEEQEPDLETDSVEVTDDSDSFFQPTSLLSNSENFDKNSGKPIQNSNIIQGDEFKSLLESRLGAVTANQSHLASNLLKLAENRFSVIDDKLSPTGLSTDDLLLKWDSPQSVISAGGPYVPDLISTSLSELKSGDLGENPEEFLILASELNQNWINLHKTQDILGSMPVTIPATEYYVSSKFGRRTDPIKKTPAVHPGVDMSGWPGEIIMSAAGGKVVKAGAWGPYGNMVEIDHGNGFRSRYGHMRKLLVQKGQILGRGQKIGEMGCSGRCTGTHLHFEVWFGDQLQDPLPYLKVSNDVLEIERRPDEQFSNNE